ncbi:MAG: NAD(P)-dependent oxidoreductase [Thermodesulfobacteriota bacterium]
MPPDGVISAAVVFTDPFFMSERCLREISAWGGYFWVKAKDCLELAEQLRQSPAVKIIVSEYMEINKEVIENASNLKGIIAYGAGYDHIDVRAANEKGVVVCNCRGENAQAVAELTFGLLLCLLRKINRADQWLREGSWVKAVRALPSWLTGKELFKKTLGIIGYGQIGSRVAKIAQGFSMEVLAFDPFVASSPTRSEIGQFVSLKDLLTRADIITLHVPLTKETENMIDEHNINLMKPGVILVNTSRGRVIAEDALLKALEEKRIGGVALDVFAREPISADHPLNKFENVMLTPHIGALTEEAGERLSEAVTRQIWDIMAGRPPECLIKID